MLAGLFSMTVVLILFFKVKIIFLSYELVFAGEQIADNSSRDSKVFFLFICFNKGGNLCKNQGSHGYKVNVLDHLNLTIVLLCVGNASDAGLILKASKFQSKYLF